MRKCGAPSQEFSPTLSLSMENTFVWVNSLHAVTLLFLLIPLILWVIRWYISCGSVESRDSIPVLGVSANETFTGVRTRLRYVTKGYEMIYMAYDKVGIKFSCSKYAYSQDRASHCWCRRLSLVLI